MYRYYRACVIHHVRRISMSSHDADGWRIVSRVFLIYQEFPLPVGIVPDKCAYIAVPLWGGVQCTCMGDLPFSSQSLVIRVMVRS